MLALVDGLPALAVVLVRPHPRPQFLVVSGHHPAFAAGGHDLVLAERPGADLAEASDHLSIDRGAVRLGAILDQAKAARVGEHAELTHFARPAAKMDRKDRLGPLGDQRLDGLRRDVSAVAKWVSS